MQSMLDQKDILSQLMLMGTEDEIDTRREAVWAVANLTAHPTADQLKFYLRENFLQFFHKVLKSAKDAKTKSLAMQGISALFKQSKNLLGVPQGEYNPMIGEMERTGLKALVRRYAGLREGKASMHAKNILENYFLEDVVTNSQ